MQSNRAGKINSPPYCIGLGNIHPMPRLNHCLHSACSFSRSSPKGGRNSQTTLRFDRVMIVVSALQVPPRCVNANALRGTDKVWEVMIIQLFACDSHCMSPPFHTLDTQSGGNTINVFPPDINNNIGITGVINFWFVKTLWFVGSGIHITLRS